MLGLVFHGTVEYYGVVRMKEGVDMRLFVAVEFPPRVMDALAAVQREIREKVERGRFKRGENFHLTLKFLGETPARTVDKLADLLEPAAKQHSAFRLTLGEVGTFGSRPPIRVVWLGLGGELEKLLALQQAVEAACEQAGFARERRAYSPHITLAQEVLPRAGQDFMSRLPEVAFAVSEYALVLSEEKDRKRIYTPLKTFQLNV